MRFSGFFDAEDGCENSRNEQQKPHGRLLLPHAENASRMLLFLILARRGKAVRGEHCEIAGVATKDLKLLVVNPQTNQAKNNDTGNNGCHNEKRPHQPLGKGALGRHAPVHFERLFVNRRAVLIFDPALYPLIRWS